jgi:mannose-6-phosphate isomerase
LGDENPNAEPWAELWLGAHPSAPSELEGEGTNLLSYLAGNATYGLGDSGPRSLPYLLKVLSAASPLSIQAHPSREQAIAGFARENQAGVPLESGDRLYKDANHKPEIISALGPFDAMCGFRAMEEIKANFQELAQAARGALKAYCQHAESLVKAESLEPFFRVLFAPDAADKKAMALDAARVMRNLPQGADRPWATALSLAACYPDDIGILAPLYLNVLRLEKRDAIFIPHGVLHAYLRGTGIELMANSDNVLRGGLTPKKVDVEALASTLVFKHFAPRVLRPEGTGPGFHRYPTDCEDFDLALTEGAAQRDRELAEILICVEGNFILTFDGESMDLSKGQSAFIPAQSGPYEIQGSGSLFRARQ